MKCCNVCALKKELFEFHKNSSRKDGHTETCKLCANARAKKWRAENPGRHKSIIKEWCERHPDRMLKYSRDRRAQNLDLFRARDRERDRRPDRRRCKINSLNRRRARLTHALSTLTKTQWEAILELFDNSCAYCGAEKVALQQEHVIPISRGGNHTVENVVPACVSCNLSKASKLVEEWRPGLATPVKN